jgi:NADH:ubiquinone oxidoreductase subunit B-like Fe-S oxidoreductase
MKYEYKGFELTHHKDGKFSNSKTVQYGLADGTTANGGWMSQTLEELQAKIDAFIADCEAKDAAYKASLVELSKQITETHIRSAQFLFAAGS